MANEIGYRHTVTGANLYAVLSNLAHEPCTIAGPTFATIVAADWGDYEIALTEVAGAYLYRGAMPAVPAGYYYLAKYDRAGAAVAITDTLLADFPVYWDGKRLFCEKPLLPPIEV